MQKEIFTAAKEAKADALVTSSTAHPYFQDTLDMVRLHDLGVVPLDPFAAMKARADLARAALPRALVDADDWVHSDPAKWIGYTMGSPALGTPCIFYAEWFANFDARRPASMPVPFDDLRRIARAWRQAGLR